MSKPELQLTAGFKLYYSILAEYLSVMFLAYATAMVAGPLLWTRNTSLVHTSLEMFCVFIELSAFIVVWFNYNIDTLVSHLMGFGFLAVAVLNLLHIYFFPSMNLYPAGYHDLGTRYWVLCRLAEAIAILGCTSRVGSLWIGKWGALLVTLAFSCGISFLVYAFPGLMPVLYSSQEVTLFKLLFEYVALAIFAVSLFRIAISSEIIDSRTSRYIFIALLFAVSESLCFIILYNKLSFFNVFGHILKVLFYFYLFRGVFTIYITYPYQRLEKANEQISELLDSLPIPLMNCNSSGKLYFANKSALGILGCGLDEIWGLTVRQFIGKFKLASTEYNLMFDEIAAMTDSDFRGYLAVITNCQGSEIKIRIDCHRSENGEYIFFFHDAKKEQELQNLQLQTKTVLDSISSFVVVTDKYGVIVLCNGASAEMIELKEEVIIGMDIRKLFSTLQVTFEGYTGDIVKRMRELSELHTVASLVTVKGNRKILLFQSSHIHNVDGEIIGMICTASDITSLQKEQQRLQQQEKLALLGQISASIVHETKNYLATIKGSSQLLILLTSDDTVRTYAQKIDIAADEVNRIVGDFLSLSKPRSPVLQEVLLNGVVQSVVSILQISSFFKEISVNISLDPDEKAVICDESQIKQVILNMCRNAVEAMNCVEAPVLQISTGKWGRDEGMYLQICDNGKGISDEQKEMLGTPFYTTKEKGTGLGLGVCFNIIREHGGRIDIDSEIGKGTCFRVLLPFQKVESLKRAEDR